MVAYLDANIFIYAFMRDQKYGASCARILREVQEGEREVSCSTVVLLECVHVFKKFARKSRIDVGRMTDAILTLPIKWLDVNAFLIRRSADETRLSGADAVHLATMEAYNISQIISTDKDFENVGIQRIDPLKS
ncbi:type II toxin-antitoxin system VapC family toxin [Candidatus Woesearchaeota archaeon]|nr:type II toxin-antitoxin system VapC family toxin [Candidatus Woesearchaeota archaeon]